jgi:CheY-like chemotaxis protein
MVRALIIDDDEINLAVMQEVLDSVGIASACCSKPGDALSLLAVEPQYDVALLDFQMPGMTGVELLKRIRSHPETTVAQLPLICLTAHIEVKDYILGEGFDGFIGKPIDLATIYDQITSVIQRR